MGDGTGLQKWPLFQPIILSTEPCFPNLDTSRGHRLKPDTSPHPGESRGLSLGHAGGQGGDEPRKLKRRKQVKGDSRVETEREMGAENGG